MSKSEQIQSSRDFTKIVTISVGQSLSDSINLNGSNLVGVRIPNNLTGTYINFQDSDSLSGSYQTLKTNNTATPPLTENIRLNVEAGKYPLAVGDFSGIEFLKIESVDSTNVAVVQTGSDAIISLVLKPGF